MWCFSILSGRSWAGLFIVFCIFSAILGCNKKSEEGTPPTPPEPSASVGATATTPSICGDGTLDPARGEQCEGGSCCDENCRFKVEGTTCDDGRDSTVNDRCTTAGACEGSLCGNGVCDATETHASCPAECPVCVRDGHCDPSAGENETTCPEDCVATTPLVVEELVTTSSGHCGIWVSPSGEWASATGEFDHPFPTLSGALGRARRDNKIICMMEGVYRLGASGIDLRNGDKIFGSFARIRGQIRRPDDFSTRRGTVIMNYGVTRAIGFAEGAGPETVLDGVKITQDPSDPNFYFASSPLVHILSSSPTFRNNTLEMPPVTDLTIRERVLQRTGVLVSSETAEAKPLIENNRIVLGENMVPYGANIGIFLRDDNRYRLAATIQGNEIQVGKAGLLTAGIMGYSEGLLADAERLPSIGPADGHTVIKKNRILFQETTQMQTRVDDRLAIIGGLSTGIALGVTLRPYRELSVPQEEGHRTPLGEKYFFATNIEANEIKGNLNLTSQSSYGLYLVRGRIVGTATKIVNNDIQAGISRTFAGGIYSQTTSLKLIHNTISGYGVSLRRSADEPLANARSCSVYLDRSDNSTRVDLRNNILTAQRGTPDYEHVGLCLTGNFPFDTPVQGNLFDSAQLNLAYAQLGGHNSRWTFSELLSLVDAGRLVNTWSHPLVFRGNLNVNPQFTDLPHGVFALPATSPAVDAVSCSGEVTDDIQGEERPVMASDRPRPLGQICDVGADEYTPFLIIRD